MDYTNTPYVDQDLNPQEVETAGRDVLEDAAHAADRIFQAIDGSQKNGINISGQVDQVHKLSGQERHEKLIERIRTDPNASLEQIVELSEQEERNYQQRQDHEVDEAIKLQDANTRNTVAIINAYRDTLIVVGVFSLVGVMVFTPGGRKLASAALKALPA